MSLGGPSRHISRAICSSTTLLLTQKFVYVCSCAHDWNPGIMVRFPHRISSIVLNQPRMWNKQVRGVLLVCLTVVGCRIWKRLKFHGRTLGRTALHSLKQFSSKGCHQGDMLGLELIHVTVRSESLPGTSCVGSNAIEPFGTIPFVNSPITGIVFFSGA